MDLRVDISDASIKEFEGKPLCSECGRLIFDSKGENPRMKQTVEEAAKKYSNDCRNRQLHCEPYCIVDFISGAEWQSKQSPWISVNERLPEPNKLVLCRMVSNGAIVSGYIVVSSGRSPYVATDGGFEFEDWNDYECDMWMPIPSFDEILEANRDVLERIKEN